MIGSTYNSLKIELKQRWDIRGPLSPDIDVSMERYWPYIKTKFGQVWSEHHCEKAGCGTCIIGDGGLKAHRSLCAAVSSGVKEFPASGVSIVTGWLLIGIFYFPPTFPPKAPSLPLTNISIMP